jgi:hypothetical protein
MQAAKPNRIGPTWNAASHANDDKLNAAGTTVPKGYEGAAITDQ